MATNKQEKPKRQRRRPVYPPPGNKRQRSKSLNDLERPRPEWLPHPDILEWPVSLDDQGDRAEEDWETVGSKYV